MARSYRETHLANEIASIRKELIAYKATQDYGAVQIQDRICSLSSPVQSTAVQVYSYTQHWIMGRVSFSGVNKNKLARGALTWTPSASAFSWYICEASDSKEIYQMKWYILVRGSNSFSLDIQAHMNMQGVLTYESLF